MQNGRTVGSGTAYVTGLQARSRPRRLAAWAGRCRWAAWVLLALVGSAFALLLSGCAGDASGAEARAGAAETTIRLGHGLDPSHPVHQAMQRMDTLVQRASGGRMRIEIYPSEQLGTERQVLELLQLGSVDMTKVSSAVMESFALPYKALGMPYLFRDEAHRFAVFEGEVGRRILLSGEDAWLRGLTFYDAGSRSFYTKETPVRRPEDLAGLKIRTQSSPVSIRMVNLLGGAATPLAFGELYSALQQGVVDGAENNAPSFYLTRHYEQCAYYSLDEHTAQPDVLLASTHLWERLSAEERRWLQDAADASAQYQKGLWAEATAEAMREVEAAGVEIIRPDKEPFRKAVEPLYEDYRANAPLVYRTIQEIRQVEAAGGEGEAAARRSERGAGAGAAARAN